jgi:hypothetical protein
METAFVVIGAVVVPLMAALHWIPWDRWQGHELHRLWAYVLGCAVSFGVPTVVVLWLYFVYASEPRGLVVVGMYLFAVAVAGMTTAIAWAIDTLLEVPALQEDKKDLQNELANRPH